MKISVSSQPIILLHVLLLSISLTITQCDDLIEQICKKTPFYDLCVSSLHSNSPGSNANVKGLASIMANLVLSDATDTLDYIQGLINQTSDPQLVRPLANCAELYIPVVKFNLPQAIDAMSRGRYGFAKYAIYDAGKQAKECEKGFSGLNGSPLADRNKLVSNLCDVAVAIIKVFLEF